MQSDPILQKFKKVYPDPLESAIKYYGVISVINDIHLTKREIELVAFAAIKGSISAGGAREEFCKKFHSTKATVNNMISSLKEKKILLKQNNKIFVNPLISPDFSNPLILQIKLFQNDSH